MFTIEGMGKTQEVGESSTKADQDLWGRKESCRDGERQEHKEA